MTDAHNHLQQLSDPGEALAQAQAHGITRMLVNGTYEADWSAVGDWADFSRENSSLPAVIPSFGLHPWHVPKRSKYWQGTLRNLLQQYPTAAIGECGLDRWKKPFDLEEQLHCLQVQIDLANEFQRPLTIHCLQAWGPLLEILQRQDSLPPFLLHAYSGSTELVPQFTELGAYFSFNGEFLHERKAAVRETFREVPLHRLLLETDAPAMLPPLENQIFTLPEDKNHPANLTSFLRPLAHLLQLEPETLARTLESNFEQFVA